MNEHYKRSEASGVRLTVADAGVAKAMLKRGDRQHDVAAWFGVNGGRIAEIASGRRFNSVAPDMLDLPPAGPYPAARKIHETRRALDAALAALAVAEGALAEIQCTVPPE